MHESGWLNRGDQFLVEMEPGSKVEVSLVLPGSANPRDVRVRFDGTTIGLVDQEDFIEHFQ